MKITPLEIRQKTFEKGFRGYEKDEVGAFLNSLSSEWERFQDENKELRIRMEGLQKEVEKLREVESSLYKTLKTAEDTGANIMGQATKMAELHMKEAEMNAESIVNDAKNKSRDTIEAAEMVAKQTIDEMESQLKNLMNTIKTLENYRDDLISDIKALSTDALDRVERLKGQIKRVDIESQFIQSRRESKKVMDNRYSENSKTKNAEISVEAKKEVKAEITISEVTDESKKQNLENTGSNNQDKKEPEDQKDKGSFFDDIQ